MPVIQLKTIINAPVERCFDLSRSIDFHQFSVSGTDEKAIAGRTKGLINSGETVTWEAKHLGIRQQLTSTISQLKFPVHFRDEQVKGIFKMFVHDHYFTKKNGKTEMTDVFKFESPLGIIGQLFNYLYLTRYMTHFLETRNKAIKSSAESDKWKAFLD